MNWKAPQNDGHLDEFNDVHSIVNNMGKSDDEGEQDLLSDEEPLGSDLDDDNEEPSTEDIVLCQFEKVSRVKSKHKCQLKDGIMHLNGKDYLFSKATCEFEFYYNT